MALIDIVLGEDDNEELILEIPSDILNSPLDILYDIRANVVEEIPSGIQETFIPYVF